MPDLPYPDALPPQHSLYWYVLERVLGQGGFGITYLARDANLDQRVAIKEYLPVDVATRRPDGEIRPRTDDQRDRYRWGLDRFINEARTLARFDHPAIVRVHSVFELNNTAYMVMRFEEGENLAARLERRGAIAESDLLGILLPILDGLERVHAAGFIHRDIKPDNIHLRTDGSPVLLDFGSARHALGNSNTLTILVAPGYAPFEQYYSDADSQGPWTDVYGLAATAYRAVTGRPPLDAITRSKGILGSAHEVLVPAATLGSGRYSARFLAAIDHGLAFAEGDRPQSIAEWRRELVDEAGAAPAGPRAGIWPLASGARGSRPATTVTTANGGRLPIAPATTVSARLAQDSRQQNAPASGVAPARRPGVSPRLVATGVLLSLIGATAYWSLRTPADDDRAKIAMLEQKLQEKERADLERALAQKARADEQASAREAAVRADDERRQADAARKREADAQTALAEQRAREAEPQRQVGTVGKATEGVRVAARPVAAPAVAPKPQPREAAPSAPLREDAVHAERAPAVAEPAKVQSVAVEPPPTPAPTPAPDPRATAERAARAATPAEAVAALRPLAEAGNPSAQEILGDHLAAGRGVARDATAAALWYEKAALRGNTDAQFKLAGMYGSGQGVAQNNNLAYIWYGTAARLGHEGAQVALDKTGPLLQPAERQQAGRVIESMLVRIRRSP